MVPRASSSARKVFLPSKIVGSLFEYGSWAEGKIFEDIDLDKGAKLLQQRSNVINTTIRATQMDHRMTIWTRGPKISDWIDFIAFPNVANGSHSITIAIGGNH
jgi:hypothetical protein